MIAVFFPSFERNRKQAAEITYLVITGAEKIVENIQNS
jgi:hypothetical protein